MRKIREILRLHYEAGLSARQIAPSIGVARSTVAECLRRAEQAAVTWPLEPALSESVLQARLYPPKTAAPGYPLPDYLRMQAELRRKGVTRLLLWQEYKATHPDGCEYSAFCDHYRLWLKSRDAVLRQHHEPGDKLFVDYAGPTVEIVDRATGEVRKAQIFVAVLGASSYTYVEATWTQQSADWLGAHVRALQFLGGCPRAVVPDNLKSGVIKAHRYEPDLNPAYQDFAEHYSVAILPARVRKPRDKAKVEVGVQVVERWILARLRHQTFFSLAELNAAIRTLLVELNQRPFKKREGCRASQFEAIDRPALQPLPAQPYEYAQWRRAKVHLDYHIEVERHYYSVPHGLIGQPVDVRVAASTIEVFHRGQRVAAHARSQRVGGFTTVDAHRPPHHQSVVNLTHARLLARAEAIGAATVAVLRAQSQRRKHPDEALRASLGILRLARDFSPPQLEAACQRAVALNSLSYRAVRTLITAPAPIPVTAPKVEHANLRGADYFT
jgi:transposase